MNVDAAWATLTSADSTADERRCAALDLLVYLARDDGPCLRPRRVVVDACRAVIRAEFAFADKFPHK